MLPGFCALLSVISGTLGRTWLFDISQCSNTSNVLNTQKGHHSFLHTLRISNSSSNSNSLSVDSMSSEKKNKHNLESEDMPDVVYLKTETNKKFLECGLQSIL